MANQHDDAFLSMLAEDQLEMPQTRFGAHTLSRMRTEELRAEVQEAEIVRAMQSQE